MPNRARRCNYQARMFMNWKTEETQLVNTISNRQVKDVKKENRQKRSDKASSNAKIKEDKS